MADENHFFLFLVDQFLEVCLHNCYVIRQSSERQLGSAYGRELGEGDGVACFFGGRYEVCPGGGELPGARDDVDYWFG